MAANPWAQPSNNRMDWLNAKSRPARKGQQLDPFAAGQNNANGGGEFDLGAAVNAAQPLAQSMPTFNLPKTGGMQPLTGNTAIEQTGKPPSPVQATGSYQVPTPGNPAPASGTNMSGFDMSTALRHGQYRDTSSMDDAARANFEKAMKIPSSPLPEITLPAPGVVPPKTLLGTLFT